MDSVSRNDQLIYPAIAGLTICDDCEVTEMVKRYPLDTTVVCCPRLCQSAKLHNKTSSRLTNQVLGTANKWEIFNKFSVSRTLVLVE